MEKSPLVNRTTIRVRFSEVDAMAIVWHGNYVKYLEDGRETFGLEHGVGYNEIYALGYTTPIVKMELSYLRPVKYGEEVEIETRFVNSEAAKLIFDYRIYRKSDQEVVLKARTVQVFLDLDGNMELNNPAFFQQWKESKGLV